MKILSYNINGLNAFCKDASDCEELYKGSPLQNGSKFCNLNNDFKDIDVYCFQETKYSADAHDLLYQRTNFDFYHAVNDQKKGYAGVLTWLNNKYDRNDEHVDKHQIVNVNEIHLCPDSIYSEGRIINTEFDEFHLINVYVPNSGGKVDLRKQWDNEFCDYVQSLNKPVIICGDFNVCATELDYWGNYNKSINSAPGLMDFEIADFDNLCTKCDIIDAYRYTHLNDRKYSWYSTRSKNAVEKNQGWRLDYFLISSCLREKIVSCEVCQGYQAPDHSPITLEINL